MKQKVFHGLSKTREYFVYHDMMQRCYNSNNRAYKNYGARDIKVCKRWRDSVVNFIEDMGYRPTPKHSLERVNNNKGYSKSNCVWATHTEQCNNFRKNRVIKFKGESMSLANWARKTGINRKALWDRLDSGWTVKKALTTPIKQ